MVEFTQQRTGVDAYLLPPDDSGQRYDAHVDYVPIDYTYRL